METKQKHINTLSLIFSAFFSLLFWSSARSQAYIPMLNSYSEWHVTNCYFGCATDKYFTVGDTVINSLHYTFLDRYHYNKNFVIREDVSEKKIYMRLLAEPSTNKEYILYDFSLQVNDTFTVRNPGSPYPSNSGPFAVDSIKLTPLVNSNRHVFYLHSLDTIASNTKTTVWIEGIGSLCLINTPGAPPQINGVGQLSCYFNNGINEYKNLDSIADCIAISTVGIKELSENTDFDIVQNFNSNTVSINFLKNKKTVDIKIYSIDGRLNYYKENYKPETLEINISDFAKGLLLLRIESSDGIFKVYKLFNP